MVRIIGHQGAAGYAPGNTLESFGFAIRAGCDRAELDVRVSKDGVLVVIHDEEVSSLTNGAGLVSELLFSELRALRVAGTHQIPTLEEVVLLCKGRISLQVELKAIGTPRKVYELLSAHGLVSSTVITSFDKTLLQQIQAYDARLSVCVLHDSLDVWDGIVGVSRVGVKARLVTSALVERAHKNNVLVYAFHAHTQSLGERMISLGVDEIGTDYPKLFLS